MSRIGKQPILIPANVQVSVNENIANVKGPKGELNFTLPLGIGIELKESKIFVIPTKDPKEVSALWGTTRAILASNIKGVVDGYEKRLQLEGLGYKAQLEGENGLILSVGYSHQVKFQAPEGIKLSMDKEIIVISGIDKQKVSQIAADIKKIKKPDPYKGKGIRFEGEIIKKKPGKKVVAAGAAGAK